MNTLYPTFFPSHSTRDDKHASHIHTYTFTNLCEPPPEVTLSASVTADAKEREEPDGAVHKLTARVTDRQRERNRERKINTLSET